MRSLFVRLGICFLGLLLLLQAVRPHHTHGDRREVVVLAIGVSEEAHTTVGPQERRTFDWSARLHTFATRVSALSGRPFALIAALLGLATMLLPLAPVTYLPQDARRLWMRHWSLPWLSTTGVLLSAGCLLQRNSLNVATWQGRAVYGGLFVGLLGLFLVYCFLWCRAERRGLQVQMPGLSRLMARTLSFIAALFLLLFAFEAVARAFPVVDSLAVNPGIHYFWPDYFDAHNSLGLDDREPGPKHGPRILVVGDSYTDGAGVLKSERFSARLEKLLAASDVEVFNAGSCGLDTFEEADVLDRVGDAIQPDIVVVGYCLNDAEGENPPSRRPATLAERVFLRTLGSYAYYRAHRALGTLHWNGAWEKQRREHGDDSPGWRRVQTGLDRIAAWCDRRHVRKVVAVFPFFAQHADGARDIMDKVEAAAQQRGFEARSTLDDFGGAWADLAVSGHDAHPGAGAHTVIARVLAEMLGSVAPAGFFTTEAQRHRDEDKDRPWGMP